MVCSLVALSGALCEFCGMVGTSHCDFNPATAYCKGWNSFQYPRRAARRKHPSAGTNRKTGDRSCISMGKLTLVALYRNQQSRFDVIDRRLLQATLPTSSLHHSCQGGCFNTLPLQYWSDLPAYPSFFPSPATLSSPCLERASTLADTSTAPCHSGWPLLSPSSSFTFRHSTTFR